jgi:hypothetical protein
MFKTILQILVIYLNILNILNQRQCICTQDYTLRNDQYSNLTITTDRFVVDQRDECDFKCIDECNREIRLRIGGNENFITNVGLEKMCDDVTSDRAVFKDGLKLWNRWDLNGCTRNNFKVEENVCCRYCKCSLSFLQPNIGLSQIDNSSMVVDLTNRMTSIRAFRCDQVDHYNECETECRAAVNDIINYDPIESIELDNYDPLLNRNDSNRICEVLNKTINSPGVNVITRIEHGPRGASYHKDINLGNICCNRTCKCEILYKHFNRTLNRTEFRIDLTNKLPKRPLSYYCNDEVRECIDDCKIAAGIEIRNEPIKQLDTSVLDINIFSNFTTARRACVLYSTDTGKIDGINLFLKYSTGDNQKLIYPFSQELYLGNICCYWSYNINFFPFNNCKQWNRGEVPSNFEDF